jgi:hypothetical protein
LLDLYPVVKIANGLVAKIGFLGQSDPSYRVNSQNNLCVVVEDHALPGDFLIDVFHKDRFDKIA